MTRTRTSGILSTVSALLAALVLSACAGLPTSGPVQPGLDPDTDVRAPDFSFLPDRPQPGATPEQIVEGFIRAGSGPGPLEQWERAREFLAPSIRSTWRPNAGVTIDIPGDRAYSDIEDGIVTLSLVAVATVDATGAYERAEAGPIPPMEFAVAQQEDGEWRITQAPDGIVLDVDAFPNVYHRYPLMYFDTTWQFLVPDVRWFPTRNAASRITTALVNGQPSEWLADAVVTAFPESVTASPSVQVDAGVAEVELSESALAVAPQTLDRMATQLSESLSSLGVTEVDLSVGSAPLAAEPVPVRSTRVTGPSLVVNELGFGYLAGDELERVPGLSDVLETVEPVSIQMTPDREWVATRLVDGSVTRQGADLSSDLLDSRLGLIDPTIDPFGVIWSVPQGQPGDLDAFLLDGRQVDIADAWSGATQITAMSISRDGTRMAAIVTVGARSEVWVAGVVRADGIPQRLGAPVMIGAVAGEGAALAWLDDTTVGVVSHEGEASIVMEQLVGGPASANVAPGEVTSIAGASTVSTVRLRAADGSLYVRRGTTWQQAASGIEVLATQQGMPQ